MIRRLHLGNFKNFGKANLDLGPFTLIVGANGSGKSNLRDAFRFLHGIGRGYSLAEIIGEKYGEGGVLQWRGIRGGIREIALAGGHAFGLGVEFTIKQNDVEQSAKYSITVEITHDGQLPVIQDESLYVDSGYVFESELFDKNDPTQLRVKVRKNAQGRPPVIDLVRQQSVLLQCAGHARVPAATRDLIRSCIEVFANMRFLDLHPDAMRQASFPGQTVLGDRGENLSSVLQAICNDPQQKQVLLTWLQELTPMDAADFAFPTDQIGRVLVSLVEGNQTQVTAYSASDGTLRFLGMLAALLGPQPARFYFFEELDNGIHPTRLHLLLQLIEQQTKLGRTQVVASTHSPQLLRLVNAETLEHTSLTYRLAGQPEAQITRILDIPEAREVIRTQDLARLHESGWLEDAVSFASAEAP
jgi:predicted ATPase